jgi:hypothetical protein
MAIFRDAAMAKFADRALILRQSANLDGIFGKDWDTSPSPQHGLMLG